MPNFNGQLISNEIFAALYNMIISQEVFADNINGGEGLVSKARVDGSLYGDTKLYYATDALASKAWGNDAEAINLLQIHRPKNPETQAIRLNVFRQIPLTVDDYLSKRAWATEGAFAAFNSVMLGWMSATKQIIDDTSYNVYIGTTKSSVGKQTQTVVLANTLTAEERAKYIGEKVANIFAEMNDYTRKYNDYGYIRKYAIDSIKVLWNTKYYNEIRKIDLPAIFHKDGIVEKFGDEVLNERYFGEAVADVTTSTYADSTPTTTKPVKNSSGTYTYEPVSGNTVILHCLEECDIPVYDTTESKYILKHYFAGDELDDKAAIKGTFTVYVRDYNGNLDSGTSTSVDNSAAFYKYDSTVICKIVVKLPPFMSAFQVGTNFFNGKSLTTNHYLTWGKNTLEYFKAYPFVTLSEVGS